MHKPLPPSRRPIVGGSIWNDVVVDLLRTEEEERDRLISMQEEIRDLRDRTDNPKTLRHLADLSDEASLLIASKVRRMGLLHTLLSMKDRPTNTDDD